MGAKRFEFLSLTTTAKTMKTCPQCQSEFADDYIFCMNDGTRLPTATEESEDETVLSARKISFPATAALSPEMLNACAQCGLQNRRQSKFCKKCGTPLPISQTSRARDEAAQTPFTEADSGRLENSAAFVVQNQVSPLFTASPTSVQAEQALAETIVFRTPKITPPTGIAPRHEETYALPADQSNYLRNWIIGLAGLLLLVSCGLGVWYWTQPNPLELKLDAAIKNKQIIAPAGANAYDFYHQLKVEAASSAVLKKYEERVLPLLTETVDDILKSVSEPGSVERRIEEWQDEVKKLGWASEIRPDDKKIAAKLAYCKGRVAYLTENKNAALEQWKRAADLDVKWALPLNGIGLIYNEKKDYETAREWLGKAIAIEPDWAIPYNNYGTSYYYQNRFDEADSYYRRAVGLVPRWARPHAWLASVAEKRNDYNSAVAEYEQVFAPDAIGTESMDIESLRRRYEKAKSNSYNYSGY